MFITNKRSYFLLLVSTLAIIGASTSCTAPKNLAYFKDLSDSVKIASQTITGSYEAHIQPDDFLGINVSSINPQATAIFNPGATVSDVTGSGNNAAVTGSNETKQSNGYLVDKEGNIEFPIIGSVKAQGLTTTQLRDSLKVKLTRFLQEPIVNVRLLNYKITIVGEVNRPSTYSIPTERFTAIDAIGLAGDLTVYGKRENVLLIREENGERKFVRLNLNSARVFQSPYFYLKQNDILYVEPIKARSEALEATTLRKVTVVASVISVLILAFVRLR